MSEEPSDEFLSGRRGLPDKSSYTANPKGRVAGCPLARREGEKLTQQQLNVETSHKKARSGHCTGRAF